MKHERTRLTAFPNTEKRVEKTTHSGVFLTNFEVFGNTVKPCFDGGFDISSQSKLKLRSKFSDKLQMKSEMVNITDKLDTLLTQRETEDEGQF